MTFDEYQKAALRTASMGLGHDLEMCIRALGLCGEIEEYKAVVFDALLEPIVKEAGDVMWYVAALADAFNMTGAHLAIDDLHSFGAYQQRKFVAGSLALARMTSAAGILAELVKKQVGHKKPANRDLVADLLRDVLAQLAQTNMVSMSTIAATNVAKLRARYPAGFDVAIASKKPDSTEAPAEEQPPSHFRHGTAHFDSESGEWKPGPV
jgi:NTP pyrophosphatase (non-canonical NTP hydrolase)